MSRIWGHAVTLVAATIAVGAVAPACAENDQSIFIRGVFAPPANRQNGVCVYQADPTATKLLGAATLDLGLRDNYVGVLLVGNQMIPRGDPTNTRAESNRVHLNGAVVRVTNPDGSGISEFTSYAMGFADPQQNNNPGYDAMGAILIDKPTRDNLVGGIPARSGQTRSLLVNVKVFGRTLGGVDIESGEFQLPVTVCNGCLVDFKDGNDPLQRPTPNCKKVSTSTSQNATSIPCFIGQDELVPCALCSTSRPDLCNPQ
jgi:hypothetical protein